MHVPRLPASRPRMIERDVNAEHGCGSLLQRLAVLRGPSAFAATQLGLETVAAATRRRRPRQHCAGPARGDHATPHPTPSPTLARGTRAGQRCWMTRAERPGSVLGGARTRWTRARPRPAAYRRSAAPRVRPPGRAAAEAQLRSRGALDEAWLPALAPALAPSGRPARTPPRASRQEHRGTRQQERMPDRVPLRDAQVRRVWARAAASAERRDVYRPAGRLQPVGLAPCTDAGLTPPQCEARLTAARRA